MHAEGDWGPPWWGETGSHCCQGAIPLRTVLESAGSRYSATGVDRPRWVECRRHPGVGGCTCPCRSSPVLWLVPAAAEGVGAEAHDDPPPPVAAASGAARDHDQCVRTHPRPRGEVGPQGDGPVCQQHHLGAVPVPQPAGSCPLHPAPSDQVAPWELRSQSAWTSGLWLNGASGDPLRACGVGD